MAAAAVAAAAAAVMPSLPEPAALTAVDNEEEEEEIPEFLQKEKVGFVFNLKTYMIQYKIIGSYYIK